MSLKDGVQDKNLEVLRAKAIEEGLAFGVTRLREEYKVKPKPDAKPLKWVKSPYSRYSNPIYLVSDCIPLAVRVKKPPTENQKIGQLISGLKAMLRSKENTQSMVTREWFNENQGKVVYLDTETTGLDSADQVIELAVIDEDGNTLFDSRFKPTVEINPVAQEVHGIDANSLATCPTWRDQEGLVKEVLLGKSVVIFNADFDLRIMRQTANAFGCDVAWINQLQTLCAMKVAASCYGATNKYGTISLANAALEAGVEWEGEAHTALADSQMTRKVLKAVAQRCEPVLEKLELVTRQQHEGVK